MRSSTFSNPRTAKHPIDYTVTEKDEFILITLFNTFYDSAYLNLVVYLLKNIFISTCIYFFSVFNIKRVCTRTEQNFGHYYPQLFSYQICTFKCEKSFFNTILEIFFCDMFFSAITFEPFLRMFIVVFSTECTHILNNFKLK